MCAVQNKLTIFAWVSQYCSIRIWSVLFRCNDFWFCFEIQSITSKDPFLNCMTLQSTWSAPKISNIWNWDPPGVVDARALGENKDRQRFRILHMLPQPVSQKVIITFTLTTMTTMTAMTMATMMTIATVMTMATIWKLEVVHKQFGGYSIKLEVVHKEVGDCT